MTTGTLASVAAFTGAPSAVSLSGASTMPDTPCAVKLCTRSTWDLRSSSLSGPFQITSTLTSRAAFSAPAWTAFQNSCVVPLGMTATRSLAGASALAAPPLVLAASVFFLQLTESSAHKQSVQTQNPGVFTMLRFYAQ